MKNRITMPILRLAYVALFLIALIAVFTLWSQVGGQGHLDLISWYWKLGLGVGAAFAITQGAAAAVEGAPAWNARSVKWLLVAIALLIGCGLASWYAHVYYEDDNQDDQGDAATPAVALTRGYQWGACRRTWARRSAPGRLVAYAEPARLPSRPARTMAP
jgi:hypothetical protein